MFWPVMVTAVPGGPEVGVKAVISASGWLPVTVKLPISATGMAAKPFSFDRYRVTCPEVAQPGTVTVTVPSGFGLAGTGRQPAKSTVGSPGPGARSVPVRVTGVPRSPESGETPVICGWGGVV